MALNLEEYQALENASLVDLYRNHQDLWSEMAKSAYQYTRHYIPPSDRVRVDDVVKALVPALAVTATLTDYLHEKRLRQKYWVTWFGDLILDSTWQTIGGD